MIASNSESSLPSLELEALVLFQSLFSLAPSSKLIKRYCEAHHFNKSIPTEDKFIKYLIDYQLDIEALEFATRSKNTVLRKKLLILIFLAEVDPIFYESMINEKDHPVFALISLFWFLNRSIYKKIKGHFLLWKHAKYMTL